MISIFALALLILLFRFDFDSRHESNWFHRRVDRSGPFLHEATVFASLYCEIVRYLVEGAGRDLRYHVRSFLH